MLGQAVAAAATRLGHDVVALSRAELDVTDADHVRRVVAAAEPRAVVNCAAWTDVDGAETAEAAATAVNGDGAGNVARAAAETGARIVHVSTDYVFDGDQARAVTSSPTPSTRSAPTGARSSPASERSPRRPPSTRSCAPPGCSAPAGATSSTRCSRLGDERDEVSVVTDQVGSPTWTGHLAEALRRARRARRRRRDLPRDRRRRLLVVRAGRRGLRPRRRALPRPADHVATASRGPRAAPGVLACSAPSATRRPCCRRGRTAWRPT